MTGVQTCALPIYLLLDGNNKICEKCKDGFYFRCVIKRCSQNSLTQSAILAADAYFRKKIIKPVDVIDHFLFVSHFAKNKHVEFESKYNSKSSVLYNFNVNLKDIKSIKNKGNYFLFYGRLSREKGISTLIDAAINANIKLKVVGEGLLLPKYKKLKHKNIEFLGFKSGAELWSLIYNSSFVVVPSEWYENNPLTIIEAYSFGKPVIGARIGGIPEIIKENITGYLFPSGDKKKIRKIINRCK